MLQNLLKELLESRNKINEDQRYVTKSVLDKRLKIDMESEGYVSKGLGRVFLEEETRIKKG